MKKYIYILNFGDYFSRLTARRIKGLGGFPKIVSFNTPYSDLVNPAGFILSGSPNGSIRLPTKILCKELFATNHPVLGICVGAHLVTRYFGGKYKNLKKQAENGVVDCYIDKKIKLFTHLKKTESVLMMHEDSIVDAGAGFEVIAHTDRCFVAATAHKKWRWYTLQFHPELSPCGQTILKNFLNLCYKDSPKEKPKGEKTSLYLKEKGSFKQSLPHV